MKRQQMEIRKRVETLVKLKRELQQADKLSTSEDGKLICWWPSVKEWEELKIKQEEQSTPLKVKKEELSTPKIPLHMKVEELPTPTLQYPSHSSFTQII